MVGTRSTRRRERETPQNNPPPSSTSSIRARRAQLELEAARRKAAIEIDLIDKQLAADMASLEDEENNYSPRKEELNKEKVEQWLDRSRQELVQTVPEHDGNNSGGLHQPLAPAPDAQRAPVSPIPSAQPPLAAALHVPAHAMPPAPLSGALGADVTTVQMLSSALRDLAAAASVPNKNLLTRLSTPKDLPDYSGDPLEWLQFRQAYDESTELCNFSPKENLWRLRKCLKGAAKEAVAALLITASSPCKIMSTLQLQFGSPELTMSKLLQDIKKLRPVSTDYHIDIVQFAVKIMNIVEAVRALGHEEYLQGTCIVSMILSKLPSILLSKWSDYSYPLLREKSKCQLDILADFLHCEALKTSATANMYLASAWNNTNKHKPYISSNKQTVLLQADQNEIKCPFCHASKHNLIECNKFNKALRKTRWQYVKRNSICFKCLLSRHSRDNCTAPTCDIKDCGQAHHRLLHYDAGHRREPVLLQKLDAVTTPATTTCTESSATPGTTSSQTVTHIKSSECKVLLKVVPIRIHTGASVISSNALLDDGSTVSLISAGLAKRAGLNGHSETLRIRGAWSSEELVCESTVINVNLSGMDNKLFNVRMRCVDRLNLPTQYLSLLNCNSYSNLKDIKDQLCLSDIQPEILIGQDNYHLLLPLEVRLGKVNEPSATLCPLGWCVHGYIHVSPGGHARTHCESQLAASNLPSMTRAARAAGIGHASLLISSATPTTEHGQPFQNLHEEVQRWFSIDSIGISGKPRKNADDVRAITQLENSAVLIDGQWHVRLPWKDEICQMPNTYPNALKRLKGIERKMNRDVGFSTRYKERVNHLLENNYAKKLECIRPAPRTWYLPHFGVDNPNKQKMRLVFDAADAIDSICLNDYLLTGPDLLSSLMGIMLRFRENKIAVTGDIKDMFLRVKIHPEDQHAFRFLWRNDPNEAIDTYVMTSLIFGANCSPFIAQYVKNINARRFESSLPQAVNAICNSHYMDDYIDSLPDEATAIEMIKNISQIHSSGGFEIRNWTSNSITVLNSVPKETLGTAAVRFKVEQQHQGERTLGLIWYPNEDVLGYDVSLKRIPNIIIQGQERPTKRIMLQVIMSVFDVYGFLAPFTIQGKIMLQDTWRLNIGWDDVIPDDVYNKWCKWINLLKEVNQIRIPRCYLSKTATHTRSSDLTPVLPSGTVSAQSTCVSCSAEPVRGHCESGNNVPVDTGSAGMYAMDTGSYQDLQLHLFSDASVKAMSAVAYWRWLSNGKAHAAFIACKCRVVPVKPITVPRSELQAALLAARLANTILKEHRIVPERRVFWCDSTTVLQWIKNDTRDYKTFEANRLGEIDELTQASEWRYVPTKLNVADLATRESFDHSLFQKEWFTGPEFLYLEESLWPIDVVKLGNVHTSTGYVGMVIEPVFNLPVPDPQRFSSWLRLVRTTATVLMFIDKCKKLTGELNCDMMARAERLLLRYAQVASFPTEITALSNGKYISCDSRLRTLSPYMDEYGLLRLGGRIDAALDVELEVKRPVILAGEHPITRLLVRYHHIKAAHGNQEMVVNNLKQKYWIIRLRPTVKYITSTCMLCRIKKSKPRVPRIGDLPGSRVAHHQQPFTFCGLDLFGPLEVTIGRGRQKRYGVIFTCLTVRAVHIELVASLTSDSLIMALRRMAARRGWPCHLYSDNGTNLRGSDKELKQAMQKLDAEVLKAASVNNAMEWHFIPPSSPHWGGAWERLIRSIKTSLQVIMKERAPREEVLSTLMTEVENMVNSRPLTHVSVDPDSLESLTPNHFLLGSTSSLPVIGSFDNSDLQLKRQWRKAQRLADMYWKRWVKEILPDMLPRKKRTSEQAPLKVGDLVLIVDPDGPRNAWPKGIVHQVYPGKDGRVRLADVRTKSGGAVWCRPVARLAPISLQIKC